MTTHAQTPDHLTTPVGTDAVDTAVIEAVLAMSTALRDGDVPAVMATYETDPTVAFQAEAPVGGTAEVRAAFEELAAARPDFVFTAHQVVVAGDLALHLAPWTMRAPGPDGGLVTEAGLSVAVLRRGGQGWRLVIDQPFGDHLTR